MVIIIWVDFAYQERWMFGWNAILWLLTVASSLH